ncbi:MAG: CHAD domain-containing protein [Nitrososphaeraceae archaeon]|nr:CHAD domain-containing protein [Nitrososphaeraceae archaeon]
MNAFPISSKSFVTKLQENIQRVDKRVNDYIADSNEDNIHDIRTAIRKVDASFRSLPKKVREKSRVYDYITASKQLFKINSQVRDYDIIYGKLEKYSSQPVYTELTEALKKRRDAKLRKARNIALSLRKLPLPKVDEDHIPNKKLQQRFNKVVTRFSDRIELNFPIVITNVNRTQQLHEMRKDCKKLRYLLEILPNQNNEIAKTITELEEMQDMLGSIHDDDIMIAYLRRVKRPIKVHHILDEEIAERNKKYEEFVQFCKGSLSNSKENFFNQIWSLT